MKNFWFIPALLLTCTLAASSPWEEFLQRRRAADPRYPRWALCLRPGDYNPLAKAGDPVFRKLITGGDFILEPLGAAAAQDLWNRRGWRAGPHWLLLTPGGEEAGDGAGRPRGEEVLDAIHARGGKPRWEAREEFLREHPDQGEALLESLAQAFQLLRGRVRDLDRSGRIQIPAWHAGPEDRGAQVPARISLGRAPGGSHGRRPVRGGGRHFREDHRLARLGMGGRGRGLPPGPLGRGPVRPHAQALRPGRPQPGAGPAPGPLRPGLGHVSGWRSTDAAGLPLEHLDGLCLPVPGDPGRSRAW